MKAFLSMVALCALLLGIVPAAQAASDPVSQLDGHVWMESGKSEKLAVIWGADCAVLVEYGFRVRAAEQEKSKKLSSSPFEKGWMHAFQDMSRAQIVEAVDAWYTAHPDELSRPVFDVLWREIISPKIAR